MKTTLLFLSVCLSANLFGQNVYIPDANFKAYLVGNSEINTNGDTEIQVSEASVFNGTIDCYSLNISDLTGIEAFTALTVLKCSYNYQITSLDVSQNTALTTLYCSVNQLTSLDLSQNTALTYLECNSNQLTSLDLSQNTALVTLFCSSNSINNFDFSQTNNLEILDVSGNPLSNLALNNLSNLIDLYIDYTVISSIDLASNIYLENLTFGGLEEDDITGDVTWSPMTSINLSSNIFLYDVYYVGGELESLDLSNCIVNGYSDIVIEYPINMSCLNLANGTNGIMPNGGDIIGLDIYVYDEVGIAYPSLCIEVDDINIANSVWNNNIDHPNYNFSVDCGDCSNTSSLTELTTSKNLIQILDLMGRETSFKPNTPLIYVYDDGTTEKVFTID